MFREQPHGTGKKNMTKGGGSSRFCIHLGGAVAGRTGTPLTDGDKKKTMPFSKKQEIHGATIRRGHAFKDPIKGQVPERRREKPCAINEGLKEKEPEKHGRHP